MSDLAYIPIASHFIAKAVRPEDIFGELKGTNEEKEAALDKIARMLLVGVHPDKFHTDSTLRALAEELSKKVMEMKLKALASISRNEYGTTSNVILGGKYIKYKDLAKGDIADLYCAHIQTGTVPEEVVLKAARNPSDQVYMGQEKLALSDLHKDLAGNIHDQCIPKFYESLILKNTGTVRYVNVLESLEGWLNCVEIRNRISGVDGRTLVWMWKRLLGILSHVHGNRYIHGAILPPHVLYFPENDAVDKDIRVHAVRLIDWCYSIKRKPGIPAKLDIWCSKYKNFYPPEIKTKVGRRTDLFMGAMTMLYLAGGNTEDYIWPSSIPNSLAVSVSKCLRTEYNKRPTSAQEHLKDFTEVVKKEYGSSKYHTFVLPEEDYHDL